MITGHTHGKFSSNQLKIITSPSPHHVPIGPKNVKPTTDVIRKVTTGTAINLIVFGIYFLDTFSTIDIKYVIKIIGITLDEYFTKVTGIPNIRTGSAASTNPINVGWSNINAITDARYPLHPNIFADENAKSTGR